MNREERKRTKVGLVVLALMIAAGAALFMLPEDNRVTDKYVVIASFPERSGLEVGDHVIMRGARVGAVQKLSDAYPQPGIAARMKISELAFNSLGQDSVAWIEYSTPEQKARVVIKPGKPDKRGRFFKIKPLRGIEPPQYESGQ